MVASLVHHKGLVGRGYYLPYRSQPRPTSFMDKKLKAEWVKALRSGEYEQGKGALCPPGLAGEDRWCCLGVLGDIAFDGYWKLLNNGAWALWVDDELSYTILQGAEKRVGLSMKQQKRLAQMNDNGIPFSEIADWIEANL